MANKCLGNIKYTTFLSKYHGVSQDINQRTTTTKYLQCHLYPLQDEGEASQSKRRKYLSIVLSELFRSESTMNSLPVPYLSWYPSYSFDMIFYFFAH